MRSVGVMAGVVACAATVLTGQAPVASASDYGFELNGTYSAVSNGEWAKHNDSFTPEGVKRDVWRMSSSCESTNRCDGTITSLNEGWTIPLRFLNDHWVAPRTIPNWAPCETGGAATGRAGARMMSRRTVYIVDDNPDRHHSEVVRTGVGPPRTDVAEQVLQMQRRDGESPREHDPPHGCCDRGRVEVTGQDDRNSDAEGHGKSTSWNGTRSRICPKTRLSIGNL